MERIEPLERPQMKKVSVLLLGLVTTGLFMSSAEAEVCKHNVCAESRTAGRFVVVKYHWSGSDPLVTHVNLRSDSLPGLADGSMVSGQQERALRGSFRLVIGAQDAVRYQLQLCKKGASVWPVRAPSSCQPFAKFIHPVKR